MEISMCIPLVVLSNMRVYAPPRLLLPLTTWWRREVRIIWKKLETYRNTLITGFLANVQCVGWAAASEVPRRARLCAA